MNETVQKYIIRILFVVLILTLCVIVYHTQTVLDQDREVQFVNRSPIFLPNAKILSALSMGHASSLADMFWIRSVLYFGRRVMDDENIYFLYELYDGDSEKIAAVADHHHHFHSHGENYTEHSHGHQDDVHHQLSTEYLQVLDSLRASAPQPPDTIPFLDHATVQRLFEFKSRGLMNDVFPLMDRLIRLNPYFQIPYLFSVYVMMETGEIDWAIRVLKRGFEYNRNNWKFPFYLGYIYWVYKGDIDTTYDYLLQAVNIPDCKPFVGELLIGFSGQMNRHNVTELYLRGLMDSAENDQVKDRISKLLSQIHSEDQELENRQDEP
ncbi:hypothetical protein JW948_10870 [bacterium]|nr:hypothetical protein [bacterium]